MTEIILTDGCTGFPEKVGHRDLTECCTVHDLGGSDQLLTSCLLDLDPATTWWFLLVLAGVLVMKLCRPAYNLLQKLGVLPKTPGSRF